MVDEDKDKERSFWLDADYFRCLEVHKDKSVNSVRLTQKQEHNLYKIVNRYARFEKQSLLTDRSIGCMLGLSIGDTYGGVTNLSLQLVESLIDTFHEFDINDIKIRYLERYNSYKYNTELVTSRVFDLFNSKVSSSEAVAQADLELNDKVSGASPAHRSVPLSISLARKYLKDSSWRVKILQPIECTTRLEAKLTHKHKDAAEASRAVNTMCTSLLLGDDFNAAFESSIKFISSGIKNIDDLVKMSIDDISNSGHAPDVFIAACWFLHNTSNFCDAMAQSKEFAGEENHCPVLVGSIGGAIYGFNEIKKCNFVVTSNVDVERVIMLTEMLTTQPSELNW